MLELNSSTWRERQADEKALTLDERLCIPAEAEGIANWVTTEAEVGAGAEDSSEENDSSLEDDDFSTKSSDFSKSDDSITTEDLLEASTEDRREVTTGDRREERAEDRTEIETEDCIEIVEGDEFAGDLLEASKEDCTEAVISVEEDEFEAFERSRDLVVMIKRTSSLNDILIDIRMSS